MSDILVFRITEDTICVDGVVFIRSDLGVYRPEREEFSQLNVFRVYIDSFLEAEREERESIEKLNFDNYLSETLVNLKIKNYLN
tara:strand:- start:958 stop:1209 length:252 start_codon:yes stop_codon:yes gene_type:complete